jgi:membrane protein DedA with SNARE-associated domain
VRSFVSVPAGVVKMPFGQFLLYTAAGSLIWNSVLIGLGVAAGDFVRDNMKYLDYVVVAAVVLGIGWMVYRRVTEIYRGRTRRYGPGEAGELSPDDGGADRPAA